MVLAAPVEVVEEQLALIGHVQFQHLDFVLQAVEIPLSFDLRQVERIDGRACLRLSPTRFDFLL